MRGAGCVDLGTLVSCFACAARASFPSNKSGENRSRSSSVALTARHSRVIVVLPPFSAKAEEDAKRFNIAGTAVAKPIVTPVAAVKEAQGAATPERSPFVLPPRDPLQVALETDEKLDAKGVVAHVNNLAGVKACAFMFGDGLSLAGNLPAEYETDGLCAMAPSLMQRIEKHMVETKLGALRGMTLSCVQGAVTFFMHENLCLAALHASGGLASEVREKRARVVHELSRKYSHPV